MCRKFILTAILVNIFASFAIAQAPTTINDFFMPGSQPLESGTIDTEDGCSCHTGFNTASEPTFNWLGSMMSNSARDPLYLATQSIANQDAPESGDLCIRCHFPKGWLEGRSTPTDGSSLTADDRHGIVCGFCHRTIKPTQIGTNPYPNDSFYTATTYTPDQTYISAMSDTTSVDGNGMYIVDSVNIRRGPYNETEINPNHDFLYNPFTRDAAICGMCHDVSNPVFERDANGKYIPNNFDEPSPSFDTYTMFPVERTFSEWKHSAYNTAEGVYAPQFGGNLDTVRTCQDCHMKDITGKGAQTGSVPTRTDLGLHDFMGGNTFVPTIINQTYPGDNVDLDALDSAVSRAGYMLRNAAAINLSSSDDGSNHQLTVTITNETGHKLPSGYPEGRRIWINVQAYDTGDNLIYESGAYDTATAVLTHDTDAKIYEIKPGISNTLASTLSMTAGPSFHFVLNDTIYSDNRIPPRGFTNAAYDSIQSPPVAYTYPDGQYWDDSYYTLPGAAAKVKVTLYYQTTSKEYVEFLRDENTTDTMGITMYNLWLNNGKSLPYMMNRDSLDLTPLSGNSAPVLAAIGDKAVDENVQLTFGVSATDPDGTIPSLTTTPLPTGANFTDNADGTGTYDWTPALTQSGTYDITFYATDDSSAVDSEQLTISVNDLDTNDPPVLTAIGNKTVDENSILSFGVSATDAEDPAPELTASPLPTGADFTDNADGSGIFEWTPDYTQSGTYDITFYATDDSSAVDSEQITITINNINRTPVISSVDDTTLDAETLLEITFASTDPDNDDLTYSYEPLPTGATITDNADGTADLTWTPLSTQTGTHPFTIYVTDIHAGADTLEFSVTVQSTGCCVGIRDDVNYDGVSDISDLLYLVDYQFVPGTPAPPCLEEADVDGSGSIDVSDLLHLVDYMFQVPPGPAPAPCP